MRKGTEVRRGLTGSAMGSQKRAPVADSTYLVLPVTTTDDQASLTDGGAQRAPVAADASWGADLWQTRAWGGAARSGGLGLLLGHVCSCRIRHLRHPA